LEDADPPKDDLAGLLRSDWGWADELSRDVKRDRGTVLRREQRVSRLPADPVSLPRGPCYGRQPQALGEKNPIWSAAQGPCVVLRSFPVRGNRPQGLSLCFLATRLQKTIEFKKTELLRTRSCWNVVRWLRQEGELTFCAPRVGMAHTWRAFEAG